MRSVGWGAALFLAGLTAGQSASAQEISALRAPPSTPASAPAPASAQSGTAAATNRIKPTRVPLDVSLALNGRFLGTISVAVDGAGHGDIDTARLVELLTPALDPAALGSLRTLIGGRARAEFDDLSTPALGLAFDPLTLQVDVSAAPNAAARTSLTATPREAPPDPASFDQPAGFSAGVNIAAGQRFLHRQGGGFQPLRAAIDGIANIGGFDGFTLTAGTDYDGGSPERFRRREIRLTHDDYPRAIRWTAGEFSAPQMGFQGSGRILGLQVERAYSTIRPFQNVRPVGRQIFTLQRESTVDVFVNDVRLQTLRLQQGRYDIADFPFAAGPNRIRLEVEDNAGRQEIAAFDLFGDASLLGRGVTDFGLSAGLRERTGYAYTRSPVASGYALHGLTDTLTVGEGVQASTLGQQGSLLGVFGSRLGFMQGELAVSRSPRGLGAALSVDYRTDLSLFRERDARISASLVARTPYFTDAFSIGGFNVQAWTFNALAQWRAFLGLQVGAGYGYSRFRIGRDIARLDMTLGRSFGRFGVNATVSRATGTTGGHDLRAGIGVSVRLGPRMFANARYDTGTAQREFELSRNPTGELDDISGSIRIGADRDGRAISGRLGYINNRFDAQLEHNRLVSLRPDGPTSAETSWRLASFIGYADGAIGIGRQVSDGFVIVTRHPSLSAATLKVRSGSRVIAQSGLLGPATFAVNRAYGANRFDLDADPIPVGYDIGAGALDAFPGFGSGYRVVVGSDASRTVLGFLAGPDGPLQYVGGTVEPVSGKGKPGTFFTNRAGRFVAERLSPGRWRMKVGQDVVGSFAVPEKQQGIVDVGTVRVP